MELAGGIANEKARTEKEYTRACLNAVDTVLDTVLSLARGVWVRPLDLLAGDRSRSAVALAISG